MAKLKRSVMQRAFSYMEIREDFLEGDDLELRSQSLQDSLNMKCLATRTVESRPGLVYVRDMEGADEIIELRPATGRKFGLILKDNSFEVIDETGAVVFQQTSVTWTKSNDVWVNPMRAKIVIGSGEGGIHTLEYKDGTWTFGDYEFLESAGGEIAQPYWAYEQKVQIQPSALKGTITVEASEPIWTDGYIGQRIRYGMREIKITERITNSVVKGEVINDLPPSYNISVASAGVFRIGEAIVGADTNYQGLIVNISGNTLVVVTTAFFEGPDNGEEISSPQGSAKVTGKARVSPAYSPLWDEPLMSPMRGYPRSASSVSGRIVFLDFESVPDLIVLSSSRALEDFDVGAEDDDAIVRQVGDGSPRWLHAVNMGDLLLFSDNGIYQVQARENGIVSPSTFNPIFVDATGCSTIEPVTIGDGVVFVDSSDQNVSAVLLDGNVYLKWSVKPLTTFHSHLVKQPKRLCGPSLGSIEPEKYMFVINGDGTVAVASWQNSIRDEEIGFTPWETQGRFINVAPIFGGYWAVTDRDFQSGTKRFLERFDTEAVVDCASMGTELSVQAALEVNGAELEVNGEPLIVGIPSPTHLAGEDVEYYIDGWDAGTVTINPDGTIDDEPDVAGIRQVGFNFVSHIKPWPVEIIESERIGSVTVRVMEFIVSVQHTHGFDVVCNGVVNPIGAYSFGDDLFSPPPTKTMVRRFPIYGNRDHPDMEIIKRRPGKFRVLATGQKVQA